MTFKDSDVSASIELRLWHPTLRSNMLEEKIGISASYSKNIGDIRKNGEIQNETYCIFILDDNITNLESAIIESSIKVNLMLSEIIDFIETGGEAWLVIRNVCGQSSVNIRSISMRELAMHGVSISIEMI